MNQTLSSLFIFAAPAAAATMPEFDTEAYCENLAEMGGGSYELLEQCLEEENEAAD